MFTVYHILMRCFMHKKLPDPPHIQIKQRQKDSKSHLLQLLVQILSPLMETHHTRNTHTTALQVRHTSRDPVGTHADSRKLVYASLCTQVVNLGRRSIQLEKCVVNGARNRFGQRVDWPLAAVDGGDGCGDYGGPFGVGVAGCWGHCCCLVFGGGFVCC